MCAPTRTASSPPESRRVPSPLKQRVLTGCACQCRVVTGTVALDLCSPANRSCNNLPEAATLPTCPAASAVLLPEPFRCCCGCAEAGWLLHLWDMVLEVTPDNDATSVVARCYPVLSRVNGHTLQDNGAYNCLIKHRAGNLHVQLDCSNCELKYVVCRMKCAASGYVSSLEAYPVMTACTLSRSSSQRQQW